MNALKPFLLAALLASFASTASDDHAEHHDHHEEAKDHTRIDAQLARQSELKTVIVGPGTLNITRTLTGRAHVDPGRVAQVRARYPGLIESVEAEPWSRVEAKQTLARVQSNDSLQSYVLRAPIGGWVVSRDAQLGQVTGDAPLFVIVDLSELWVELDVFDHDLDAVKVGQAVTLYGLHGEHVAHAQIDQLSPLAIHAAQSVRARVIVPNPDETLRPGQYLRANVVVEQRQAPLVVPKSAVQYMRGASVVFEQLGDEYHARELELGASDADEVEVLGGLDAGARVVSHNSYLIKADLEKSGASHDH